MSVMTTIAVVSMKGDNLVQRMRSDGLVRQEGFIDSKGQHHIREVLDFARCDNHRAEQLLQAARDRGVYNPVERTRRPLTEDEEKYCCYGPVYQSPAYAEAALFSYNYYHGNYDEIDFIAAAYPGEVFGYQISTEGCLDGFGYCNDKGECTADGTHLEQRLPLPDGTKAPRPLRDDTVRVSVPVSVHDKKPAYFDINKRYVIRDLVSDSYVIGFPAKDTQVVLHRTDRNGKQSDEVISAKNLCTRVGNCRDKMREQEEQFVASEPKRKKRRLPDTPLQKDDTDKQFSE